jgi:hypothetical protein
MRWLVLLVIAAIAALIGVMACSSTPASTQITSVKWNVKSLSSTDSTGKVSRADVTGYYIFRSDGSFVEDITIAHLEHTQVAEYNTSNNDAGAPDSSAAGEQSGTISLVNGVLTLVYTYQVSGDGQTMTWDSLVDSDAQDVTRSHWVLTFDSTTTQ